MDTIRNTLLTIFVSATAMMFGANFYMNLEKTFEEKYNALKDNYEALLKENNNLRLSENKTESIEEVKELIKDTAGINETTWQSIADIAAHFLLFTLGFFIFLVLRKKNKNKLNAFIISIEAATVMLITRMLTAYLYETYTTNNVMNKHVAAGLSTVVLLLIIIFLESLKTNTKQTMITSFNSNTINPQVPLLAQLSNLVLRPGLDNDQQRVLNEACRIVERYVPPST